MEKKEAIHPQEHFPKYPDTPWRLVLNQNVWGLPEHNTPGARI